MKTWAHVHLSVCTNTKTHTQDATFRVTVAHAQTHTASVRTSRNENYETVITNKTENNIEEWIQHLSQHTHTHTHSQTDAHAHTPHNPFIRRLDCWFLIGLAACVCLILVLLPSVFSSLSELIKKSLPVNTLPDRYHCLINSHTQTHMS